MTNRRRDDLSVGSKAFETREPEPRGLKSILAVPLGNGALNIARRFGTQTAEPPSVYGASPFSPIVEFLFPC